MKNKIMLSLLLVSMSLILMSQVDVMSNGNPRIGGVSTATATAILYNNAGSFAQANGFIMNKNTATKGWIFEHGATESGGFYADGDYAVIWSAGDYDRLLRVYDEDAMSSTSTTHEKFYVDGDGDSYKASDGRRKENVKTVHSPLEKVKALRGVDYEYIKTEEELKKSGGKKKKHVGFIAQELEMVIPEVVDTDEHGNKFVSYDGVVPYLVEAIKQQQAQIEALQKEVNTLKNK